MPATMAQDCIGCGVSVRVRVGQVTAPTCVTCRAANVVHGKASTYAYRKCRCDSCRAAWSAKCNERQKAARRERGLLKEKRCVICDEQFNPHGQQVTCSVECRRTYSGKTGTHRDRATYYGVQFERVDRAAVFERDRWSCGICGESVDPALEYPNQDSASLDHITPISRGGDHIMENVQLAHMGCNRAKSNK